MENLIVIEGKEKYQYRDIESLVEKFINENYFYMTEADRKAELEKRAIINNQQNKIKICKLDNKTTNFDKNAFIIYDEITYILSLLKFNKIILLEKTNANILGKYINKENIDENYLILNRFADEIMQKYLENN